MYGKDHDMVVENGRGDVKFKLGDDDPQDCRGKASQTLAVFAVSRNLLRL